MANKKTKKIVKKTKKPIKKKVASKKNYVDKIKEMVKEETNLEEIME